MGARKAKPELIFKALAPANKKLMRDQVMDLVLHLVNIDPRVAPLGKTDLAGFDGLAKFPHKVDFVFRVKAAALAARGAKNSKKLVLHLTRTVPAEWAEKVRIKDIQAMFVSIRRALLARMARGEMGTETPQQYVARRLAYSFPGLEFTSFETYDVRGTKRACTRFLCWYQGVPMDVEVFHPNTRNPFI